ncbi:MAG: hypothetical protein COA97_12670 [Flavobacteriales bacterium]|nr:MAG: hypothetical protein COA97_12670 [Flavobacteriales bacterium]
MQITPLKEAYIKEVILISNDVFGDDYLTIAPITQYIGSSNKLCFVLLDNKKVTSYILIDVLTFEEFIIG